MTEKEKTLWKEAIKYVDEHYGDCPDYIRLVFSKFDELNSMDRKKIAKVFVDCFKTDIKEVILEGDLKGGGGTVEKRNLYEVIFANYNTYQKREFSNDYRDFAKKIGEIYGVDWRDIKRPANKRDGHKTFYYRWDQEQLIEVDGLKFRMGRRMMNMPHAVLDGCSHVFYIDLNDRELAEEISKIHNAMVADKEKEKKDAFPGRVRKAKEQCREMIEELTKWANGEFDFDDNSFLRINNAHFDVCQMLKP